MKRSLAIGRSVPALSPRNRNGRCRARTGDLFLVREALSQLS
jgi:hypothetical protein